jgi:basic membrane protein A
MEEEALRTVRMGFAVAATAAILFGACSSAATTAPAAAPASAAAASAAPASVAPASAAASQAAASQAAVVASPGASAAASCVAPNPNFKVGLVTDVGGLNDKSFNHLAYLGVEQAQCQLGATVEVIQSSEQAQYVPNLTTFAQKGDNLVIAVGFLMANAVYTVATQYPKVHFAAVDTAPADAKGNTVNLPNVANLFFHEQESGYAVGYLAGLMEKDKVGAATTNTISYMGGLAIPPVDRYIAGYIAGAKAADPSITIIGGYSQSFTDQTIAKSIGLNHISRGSSILFQVAGSSGLGYLQAAVDKGVYGIGVDADQNYVAPATIITSAIKKVNVAVFLTIQHLMQGTFQAGDNEFTLKDNATGFAPPNSAVPASIVAQVQQVEDQIASGAIVPPMTIPK